MIDVIDKTPLVSIDLIVRNSQDEILLGKRTNRPAQGCWFVPGGRIVKGEHLDAAFRRISKKELGIALERRDARLLGAYEHHYDDNFLGREGVSTHYVVLAHAIELEDETAIRSDEQHEAMHWWATEEILDSPDVHDYTKDYFRDLS